MLVPFDFAWSLLKARSQFPHRDFKEETSLADELDPNIHEAPPFVGHGTADDAPPLAPDLEAESAEGPSPDITPDEKLEALLREHPELADRLRE